jgi:hypothetical protein
MDIYKIFIIIFITIISSSCSLNISRLDKIALKTDCNESSKQIALRKNLFSPLDQKEINRRKKINLPSISQLDEESSISIIATAIRSTPKDSKFIKVDLRYYNDVDLTNIIFANESDFSLKPYLFTSKYSQGFFSLINFNEKFITILPPEIKKIFSTQKIYRPDLINSEIVINASNSKVIFGNLKFSKNIKFSLIADSVKDPLKLDLREASNMQFNLNRKWIMPVYSVGNSRVEKSKITTAYVMHIDNQNSLVSLDKFYKSVDRCYVNNDNKFKIIAK